MSATNGVLSLADLLAVKYSSAASFGLDTIRQVLDAQVAYDRAITNEQISQMCDFVTDQSRIYGLNGSIPATEVDEFGKAVSGKQFGGVTVQFPIKQYSQALGWTEKFFQQASPAEMAGQYLKMQEGYQKEIQKQIKKAIYKASNYSVVDKLTNGVTLNVKRLLNADGADIPDNLAGTSFDGATHNHYMSSGTLTPAEIDDLVATVVEHDNTKGLRLVIAQADKAAVSSFASTNQFVALSRVQLVYGGVVSTVEKADIEGEDLGNELIGYWGASLVPVYVKPWAISKYILCYAANMPEKILCYRQRPQPSLQGWRIAAKFADHPLYADYAEFEFGLGVWNRTAGAVLYFANSTWSDPTIS